MLVGICVERGIKMVVGLLGILKAGWMEVFKTNSLMNYVPQAVIPMPITLFRAEERLSSDSETEPQELQQKSTSGRDDLAKGPVEVISVPGNHMTMMRPPYVQVLAKRLKACLRRM